MDLIANYLRDGSLPDAGAETHMIKTRAARLCLVDNKLYQKSYQGLYLLCVGPSEAERIMAAIHNGDCGNLVGERSLVHEILKDIL